jgi:hypothetical protein
MRLRQMIQHTEAWKQELIREAEWLRFVTSPAERHRKPANRHLAYAAIEKFAFTSAYYIRKLTEAKQLSDELESTPIDLIMYLTNKDKPPIDKFATYRLSEHYNFRRPQQVRLPLDSHCNLLIHSILFAIRFWKDNARVSSTLIEPKTPLCTRLACRT